MLIFIYKWLKKAISALQARKLFYWSIRFAHWDSCRYMGEWTAALQVRKTERRSFLSAVSLCLSRACLGKMIVFSLYVNGSKMPFFAGRL